MQFAANFDVKITFNDPASYAGFAADFARLYEKYCSGATSQRARTQAAVVSPDVGPPPALPPATFSAPEPQQAVTDMCSDAAADSAASAVDVTESGAVKPRRTRRTKAEMEAARAAEAAATAELPKAHGGSNTGTTAPTVQTLPDAPPMPSAGPIVMPEGEITPTVLAGMFGRFMMLKPDPLPIFSMEVMTPLGLSRVREAKPEQYRALCEGMVRIAASLS
jgi:hypothetical protein